MGERDQREHQWALAAIRAQEDGPEVLDRFSAGRVYKTIEPATQKMPQLQDPRRSLLVPICCAGYLNPPDKEEL
jgi:hypothetical protein